MILENSGISVEDISKEAQYKDLIRQASEGSKQIWLTDAETSKRSFKRSVFGAASVTVAGSVGVIGLIKTAFAATGSRLSHKPLSRRKFVKATALSVGLLSPLLTLSFLVPLPRETFIPFRG
ncbi:MAG: twin-arginine translocation signal domain-containing protein [Candidatus Diapherotrites archaeon]